MKTFIEKKGEPRDDKPRLKAWSYSTYSSYCDCPLKVKFNKIMRLPDPSGPAAERGTMIHQAAQDYVEKKREDIEPDLRTMTKQLGLLRTTNALCEIEWGFTVNWEPCTWQDSRCWLRVKTDVIYSNRPGVLSIWDWKTGRIYMDKHELQTELYAVAGLLLHPTADLAETSLLYTDQDATTTNLYARTELPTLINRWETRVAPMMADTSFVARPGEHCRYCTYRKSNRGPCKHG